MRNPFLSIGFQEIRQPDAGGCEFKMRNGKISLNKCLCYAMRIDDFLAINGIDAIGSCH